jgi:hypothetical protein
VAADEAPTGHPATQPAPGYTVCLDLAGIHAKLSGSLRQQGLALVPGTIAGGATHTEPPPITV